MQDPRLELERLYEVEYGETAELTIRLVGVAGGSVLLYLYTGWLPALWWSAIYLLLHVAHFRFLKSRLRNPATGDVTRAGLLYVALLLAFIWVPGWMAGQADPVLSFVGTVLIVTTMAFLIRRADKPRWLLGAEIAVITAMWMGIFVSKASQMDMLLQQAAILIASFAASLYLAQALVIARRTRLAAEAAAERAAQDQKMSAIGRLAGGVAHDFNNALTVIRGNLELHGELHDRFEREKVLAEALAATIRAETVVRDLLVYARKAPVRARLIDCAAALARIEREVRPGLPPDVTLVCRADRVPHHIRVDEALLGAALLHLLRNAVDAMSDPGRIVLDSAPVTLSAPLDLADKGVLPEGRYVRISVIDDGAGIPQEHLRRVLDPFYTTKAVGQGTGLGLSVVSGFMREAGGGMTIESSGKGTCVRLYLPMVPGPAPARDPRPETQNAAPGDGVLTID